MFLERRTRIKVVAFALMALFLASVAVASFASASNSNTAAGTYLTFAMQKSYGYGPWINLLSGWTTLISITTPNVGYAAWYQVSCDGYANVYTGNEAEIAIGVDSTAETASTRRFYEATGVSYFETGLHTEKMFYLGAGTHTFYFLARRYTGTGTVTTNYHTITVTFFTDAYVSQMNAGEVGGSEDGPR
jgi:hypothetical protein